MKLKKMKLKKKKEQLGVGTLNISPRAKAYVNDVLKKNRLSYGPYSEKLERRFAELHQKKFGIFCNSGTSALQVALAALKELNDWDDGDEIIVPAITFIATSNIVLQNKLVPVFVDVDERTYNINPLLIKPRISSKTRAVLPVNLFGLSCEADVVRRIADEYKLAILEDSCESMFVKHRGKPIGYYSDVVCFSTYVAHLLVTGVGGIVLTDDSAIAVMVRSLCNHGRDSIYLKIDDDKGVSKEKLQTVVSRRFSFVRMGYSYRCTELEAALGLAQLEENPLDIIRKRQSNALKLINGLKRFAHLQLPLWPSYSEHAFMMFPIVIRPESHIKREDLVMHLENYNIETRFMMPLLNQPFYKKLFGDIERDYPIARWINQNGFYIGCHQDLDNADIKYIIEIFELFFKNK